MKESVLRAVKRDSGVYDRRGKILNDGDIYIERAIIIGLITSDRFAEWVYDRIKYKWIQSETANKLVRLLSTYYEENSKAPKKDITDLYFEWLRNNIFDKDEAEEVEQHFLPDLSDEYIEKGLDIDKLIQRAGIYFDKRSKECYVEQLQDSVARFDDDEFELLTHNPPQSISSKQLLSVREIDDFEGLEQPKLLFEPWLREGEYTLLYADKGVGKSMLGILIAHLLSTEDTEDSVIDTGEKIWRARRSAKTLYITGEMAQEVQRRFKQFTWSGEYIEDKIPERIDRTEEQVKSGKDFSLARRDNQRSILAYLKENPKIRLVIIDNVQTLFDIKDSHHDSEWNNNVSPFLRDLEYLGVACLVIDHTGKNPRSGAMGTHAKITQASNVIYLENHPDKRNDQAWFKIEAKYQRYPESIFNPFYIRFNKRDDGTTDWEVTGGAADNKRADQTNRNRAFILKGLQEGRTQTDIADDIGMTKQAVSGYVKKMKEMGYISGKKVTEAGKNFITEWEDTDD